MTAPSFAVFSQYSISNISANGRRGRVSRPKIPVNAQQQMDIIRHRMDYFFCGGSVGFRDGEPVPYDLTELTVTKCVPL